MTNPIRISLLFLAISCLFLLTQCRKKTIITSSDAKLAFSRDTVLFDTVFTTIGSTTQVLKLYNNHSQAINISKIEIPGGINSQFRMNVDGVSGYVHQDVEIDAEDSLFVFVEVTVDPNSFDLPFILEDSIVFVTNNNHQAVKLHAWGQNAVFHGALSEVYALEDDELEWDNNLPHVLYGIVAVDSAKTLTIYEGTQVHCHNASGLLVYKSTLDVQGSLDNEVVFQGDRLEPVFSDEPGQWGIEFTGEYLSTQGITEFTVSRGGIWFIQSRESVIDYAIIKNGVIGLQVDSLDLASEYSVDIKNTKVFNHSAIGILTQGADVNGVNNLFANCGQTCGQFTIGGKLEFELCTFANHWSFGTRQAPAFILRNYYEDVNENIQIRPFNNTLFTNCIMHGNNAAQTDFSEFIVDMYDPEDELQQDFLISSSWVDTNEDITSGQYFDMHNSETVNFKNPTMDDFHLIQNLIGGSSEVVSDIEGLGRSNPPRVGCYETNGD